jgi:hypothetical protein
MQLTPQEMKNQFINAIMKDNGVTLKAVHDCIEGHKDDIDKMDQIFDSDEGECVNKRMVLLYLISRSYSKENMDLYRTAKNIKSEFGGSTDIEEYKVLIITALVFNTMFYTLACNWCGLIRREVLWINGIKERLDLTAEGFSEYLELENRIITIAKDRPYEKLSDIADGRVAWEIRLEDGQDGQNDLSVTNVSYNKETKTINISCDGKMAGKKFTLWVLEKGREFEPIPICLQPDNKGNLRGELEEEIPEMGKYVVSAETYIRQVKTDKAIYELSEKENGDVDLKFNWIEPRKAAASQKDDEFKEFFRCEGITHKGISGTLIFEGNNQNQISLRFEFDKFYHKIPFNMTVHFKIKKEGLPLPIELNKRTNKNGKSVIETKTDIDGILYSDGIEGFSEEDKVGQ